MSESATVKIKPFPERDGELLQHFAKHGANWTAIQKEMKLSAVAISTRCRQIIPAVQFETEMNLYHAQQNIARELRKREQEQQRIILRKPEAQRTAHRARHLTGDDPLALPTLPSLLLPLPIIMNR